MISRLCVVPCGHKKIWAMDPDMGPVQARDAYVGSFSRLCRAYAERFFNDWVILSAKHGFLRPDDIVPEDYDVSFSQASSEPITVGKLRAQIRRKGLTGYDSIVVLGGRRYVEIVMTAFGKRKYPYELPLSDAKGIGTMMHRLRKALDEGEEIGTADEG